MSTVTPVQSPDPRIGSTSRTRRLLADAALDLFEQHGYDQVAVGQVAAAAGVAERTAFRHFPTKPSLVLDGEPGDWDAFLAALHASGPTVLPGAAVATANRDLAPGDGAERDDLRRVALIRSTPSLRSAWLEALTEVEHRLRGWLAQRSGRSVDDVEVLVGAACLIAAHRTVVLSEHSSIAAYLRAMDRACALVDRGLGELAEPTG